MYVNPLPGVNLKFEIFLVYSRNFFVILQTGEKCLSVPKNGLSIKVCRFSPNGKFIITGGDDEKAVIWNVETMEAIS